MTLPTLALRIGTRGSLLARTQTGLVVDAITASTGTGAAGGAVEIVHVVTTGDRSSASIEQLGGTGVFVSALRDALLRGEIDVAVHSYKDLPTAAADGIVIAAVPPREDPRDALVSVGGQVLGELAPGARVGTGSPRRAAQLRALGLGLEIVPLRGNIDTRLGKVTSGELDAVVLALAGLRRIGRTAEISEVLDPIQVLPAPAQGALAIECRADDLTTIETLARIDHADTRAVVGAERALLAALEAGCSAPVGALGEVAEDENGTLELFLRGSVTALDGSDAVRLSATGSYGDPGGLGQRLADDLIADGAQLMMGGSR